MMITGDDIINMSKSIALEYEELVAQQLKPYLNRIEELSKEIDNTKDTDEWIKILGTMTETLKEMENTREELMINPEYIMKFTLAKMTGQA